MNTCLPPQMVADALWLLTARARGSQQWVANSACTIDTTEIHGRSYPVSLQDQSNWQTSYVVSPRSTWLRYARQEALRRLNPGIASIAKFSSALVFCPLSTMIYTARLDQSAIIGNHLISTNLYPEWDTEEIRQLTINLSTSYPQRPAMIRNVCDAVNPSLRTQLEQHGWECIPSRLVYLCNPQDTHVWKHNHVKQDARLLADGKVEIVPHDAIRREDLPELRQIFRQLFIEKHSYLNPDFTLDFFELCLETRFLEFTALRYEGHWAGIVGIYAQAESGWLTTPLIGYDTRLPQELGLYRRLMAVLLQQAREKQLKLHYSSGAGAFKQARGGQASLEYTAVYSRHLPKHVQFSQKLFSRLMQKFAPALLKRAERI